MKTIELYTLACPNNYQHKVTTSSHRGNWCWVCGPVKHKTQKINGKNRR